MFVICFLLTSRRVKTVRKSQMIFTDCWAIIVLRLSFKYQSLSKSIYIFSNHILAHISWTSSAALHPSLHVLCRALSMLYESGKAFLKQSSFLVPYRSLLNNFELVWKLTTMRYATQTGNLLAPSLVQHNDSKTKIIQASNWLKLTKSLKGEWTSFTNFWRHFLCATSNDRLDSLYCSTWRFCICRIWETCHFSFDIHNIDSHVIS